jgi:Beta-xylosidase
MLVLLVLVFSAKCLSAEDFNSLDPPTVLKPVPAQYGDDKRLFQGIPSTTLSPQGRVWVNWYAGGDSEGDENYVLLATSGDRAKTWSKPLLAIDIPGPVRAYDPSMWTDPDGKVWLFWAQSNKWWDGRSGVWCMVSENADKEIATWSKPRRICDGIMMCKPIVDSKGRWLLPVSIWPLDPKHTGKTLPEGANVVVSDDQGETWKFRV